MTSTDVGGGLHPRGRFAVIGGVEYPAFGSSRASRYGLPIDSVALVRADAPAGLTELRQTPPMSPAVLEVPRSEVDEVAEWVWVVEFESAEYDVANIRDGLFLIGTMWPRVAATSDEWEGSFRDCWGRWIDPTGLPVRDERREYGSAR